MNKFAALSEGVTPASQLGPAKATKLNNSIARIIVGLWQDLRSVTERDVRQRLVSCEGFDLKEVRTHRAWIDQRMQDILIARQQHVQNMMTWDDAAGGEKVGNCYKAERGTTYTARDTNATVEMELVGSDEVSCPDQKKIRL